MKALLAVAAVLAAGTPDVQKLTLTPAQVGAGYVLVQRTDGKGVVNTVTLNLCGPAQSYPSESRRVARLQVDYLKQKSTLGLSNEVVAYRSGGAAQAMREVVQHVAKCPKEPIVTDASLPPLTYTLTRIKASNLLKGAVALRVRVTGKVQGKKVDQTSYAIYQRKGDVLSGTYSFGPNTKAQLQFALHAAQQSALNLRLGRAAGGGPTA
jgi:hypothetical protein